MNTPSDHQLMPAIGLMERKVEEAERKAAELLGALNILRTEAGLPIRVSGTGAQGSQHSGAQISAQIKADTFFGKKQQTAIRQYLEMRKASGQSTAKPREIFEALQNGGYEFETKSEDNALVGIRALLRKRTETFVQLNNGTYGLVAWYPELKRQKSGASSPTEKGDAETGDPSEKE